MSSAEKEKVSAILCRAFENNLSVGYTIGKSGDKTMKIRRLIGYSMKIAEMSGKIFLQGNAAALITFGDKKAPFHRQLAADLGLVTTVIGLKRLKKVISRNNYIKSFHPQSGFIYLWLIGTDPQHAGKGEGTALLLEILSLSARLKMPLYLETSMPANLAFYEKNGFHIYHEKMIGDSGFLTYFMKNDAVEKIK
jgi:ribosomal protein S18 acetylase RimI-like enzyme